MLIHVLDFWFSLINIILQEYYKGNNKIIESNVCYISLLKDQGINFYKNEVRIFINNCISNSYKKFIVIEDVEFFGNFQDHVCSDIIISCIGYNSNWSKS